MDFDIKRGFIIADSGKPGPLYVAPHAAPAYYKPGDHQDHNTHYISFKLATYGGKALISTLSRERDLGIDFYRPFPSIRRALKAYPIIRDGKREKRRGPSRTYAWAAKNMAEHATKMKIYTHFWSEVKRHDGPLVFIHRQFFNPIRHPSIMDVIPFDRKEKFIDIVAELNEKYADVLSKMFPIYKAGFEFKNLCVDFKVDMLEKHKLILYHGKEPKPKKRREKFRKVLKKLPELKITCMQNFKGVPLRRLMTQHKIDNDNPIFQAEINEFLARRFPDIAVYMIRDILKEFGKDK
jgi:hypothetical protein